MSPASKWFLPLLTLGLMSLSAPSRAEITIPTLSAPVIDDADFFTASDEKSLTTRVRALYASGGPQLQIWTLQSLSGEPIESVSMRAVESWTLGRADKDDGLLLMIARQERRFRLEVGQGLEGTIPDALAGRLLRQYLLPAMRQSRAADGVGRVIDEISQLTLNPADADAFRENNPVDDSNTSFGTFVNIFVILLFLASSLMSAFFGRARRHRGRFGGFGYGGWSGGGGHFGRGGSFGGGGGGWSGGGGGFSGGGASGGW